MRKVDDSHIDEKTKRKRSVTIAEQPKPNKYEVSPIGHHTNRSLKLLEKSELIDASFKAIENCVDSESVDNTLNDEAETFDITQKLKM